MADSSDLDFDESADNTHLSTAAKLMLHERICGFRYKTISARLARIEKIMLIVTGFLLSGMLTMIVTMLTGKRFG